VETHLFDIRKSEGSRGFRLSGELDIAGRTAFTDAIAPEIGRDGDLTLDLSALTFIDSAGVQALITTAENLKERGRLILRAPGKTVMRVFELMRLDTVPNMDIATGRMPEDERT
jgi:anti-sigma B factor antagonist